MNRSLWVARVTLADGWSDWGFGPPTMMGCIVKHMLPIHVFNGQNYSDWVCIESLQSKLVSNLRSGDKNWRNVMI